MEICRYFAESIKLHPVPQINHSGKEYVLHFCAALGYFSENFHQRKRSFFKENADLCVRKMALLAWGLSFFGGRKERE